MKKTEMMTELANETGLTKADVQKGKHRSGSVSSPDRNAFVFAGGEGRRCFSPSDFFRGKGKCFGRGYGKGDVLRRV